MKNQIRKTKEPKGITLIALVITILVLIILAGVTLNVLTGENGIITKAVKAKEDTETKSAEEQLKIAVMSSMDFANGTSEILIDELNKNIQEIKGLEENTLINKLPTIVTINDVQYEIEYNGEVVKLNTLLPEGYVGVEYIEGNGRQNIDLGMKGNNHLVYQIKFLQKEYYGGVTVGVYDWVGNGPYDDQRLFMTGGNLLLDWVHSVRLSKEYDNLLNVVHNYEFGNRYVKDLETNELLLNGSLYETEFETNNNIIIGGAALQVYSLKIFDNGKIVRNMKPCRRTADNKVGMYDLVEDKFYSSNSTTEYIAGNEI